MGRLLGARPCYAFAHRALGAVLLLGAAAGDSSSARMVVGATVVTPCKIAPDARDEAGASAVVTCADAKQPQPRIVREVRPSPLVENEAAARSGKTLPVRTSIIF
ncbi:MULTISPECIES: hypothetical protein [Phenylobacterium]|uniref:Uncharacterized protein n=1 Tax=Phenylobacterium koreense TaxID=266125 RepID=A0ABV2EGS0_9CAUL